MIKFVHKKNYNNEVDSKGKLVITYTGSEIFLGLLLLITNIMGMVIIYSYTFKRQLSNYPRFIPQAMMNLDKK